MQRELLEEKQKKAIRGREAKTQAKQLLRMKWKQNNYFSKGLKALTGVQQLPRRSSSGTTCPHPLLSARNLVVGDRTHWYSISSRKHSQTAKPGFTFKDLESHCSCLTIFVMTIISRRMIATASLSKHLQKINIATDLCGTESLNSGRFMFKGSNYHVTLSLVYVGNLTRQFSNQFKK